MAVNEALWVIKSVSELFQNRRKKVDNAFFLMHEEYFFSCSRCKERFFCSNFYSCWCTLYICCIIFLEFHS